jgi:hypothetical protein
MRKSFFFCVKIFFLLLQKRIPLFSEFFKIKKSDQKEKSCFIIRKLKSLIFKIFYFNVYKPRIKGKFYKKKKNFNKILMINKNNFFKLNSHFKF